MMQTEPQLNPGAPAMTRTRCPGCQKLFAVETETLNSMSRAGVTRAEFTCTGSLCRESFAIELPLPLEYSTLTILPAVRLSAVPETEPVADLVAPAAQKPAETPRSIIAAPLKQAAKSAFERECPRCGAMNAATMNDCVRCGIIFERYNVTSEAHLEEELALGGTRELALMWDKTLEDYEDRIRHDRFLNACRDANALSYASKKYSQILVAAPQDDIARRKFANSNSFELPNSKTEFDGVVRWICFVLLGADDAAVEEHHGDRAVARSLVDRSPRGTPIAYLNIPLRLRLRFHSQACS